VIDSGDRAKLWLSLDFARDDSDSDDRDSSE
jgi:hypothetical protein